MKRGANNKQRESSLPSPTLLGRIGNDLKQEHKILNGLAWLCEQGKEGHIAQEIRNASRTLAVAIELITSHHHHQNQT